MTLSVPNAKPRKATHTCGSDSTKLADFLGMYKELQRVLITFLIVGAGSSVTAIAYASHTTDQSGATATQPVSSNTPSHVVVAPSNLSGAQRGVTAKPAAGTVSALASHNTAQSAASIAAAQAKAQQAALIAAQQQAFMNSMSRYSRAS